ncbi:unnamed protein product [Colias eurytheme]|nr:unnamed protein product [Colias eurytheme]
MRLFGSHLSSHGSALSTYFRMLRPRSVPLDFREILKRVNTPFMFCLKVPGSASLAEGIYKSTELALLVCSRTVFGPAFASLAF